MDLTLWTGIALLQLLVLPGWLLARALGLDRDGPLQTALYGFGLSLLFNHALVVALVGLGAYTRPVVVAIFAAECALALWWLRPGARRARPTRPACAARLALRLARADGVGDVWPLLAAVATTGFLLSLLPYAFGRVFEYWDVIVSWNRWAVDWEAGRLPAHVYHYPQLLPTSWSLVYVVLGQPLQFVARGVMALFPLAIALVFVDLWWQRDRRELLVAAVVATLLLVAALGPHMGSGLADIPVAALGLLAFHPLAARPFDGEERARTAARLVAAALLGTACALTKQAGLYVVVWLPVYAFFALRGARVRRVRAVLAMAALLLLGVGPWYAYVELRVAQGMEVNEVQVLPALMFGDTPLLDRARFGWAQWEEVLTPPGAVIAALLVLASLAHREARWITLCISLPFTLIWACWISYDLRNHALALPFLGASIAGGLEALRRAAAALPARARRPLAAAAVAGALLWIAWWVPPDAILAASERQLVAQGSPALNRALLAYAAEHGFDGPILSNYRYLTSFPSLREHYFHDRDASGAEFWTFRTGLPGFRRVVEDPALGVRYVLVSGDIDEDIARYLDASRRAGHYEIVVQEGGARLYRLTDAYERRRERDAARRADAKQADQDGS